MSALPPKADMETFGYSEGRLGKMIALPSVPAAMTMPSNAGSDHYCDHHDGRWWRSRCLDVRHATSSAFKSIKVWQVAKSRRYSSKPH